MHIKSLLLALLLPPIVYASVGSISYEREIYYFSPDGDDYNLAIAPPVAEEPEQEIVQENTVGDKLECYCVKWLREKAGINIKGNAWDIQPNTSIYDAKPGDVVLFSYPTTDHAAGILSVSDDNLGIIEANYSSCKVTTRVVERNDPYIRGIYRPLEEST